MATKDTNNRLMALVNAPKDVQLERLEQLKTPAAKQALKLYQNGVSLPQALITAMEGG